MLSHVPLPDARIINGYINLSVDVNNYKPVSMEEVNKIIGS